MKQTMFESLVEEFPKQEKQLDIIFGKLGLDKSCPNPESGVQGSDTTINRYYIALVRVYLIKTIMLEALLKNSIWS